MDVSIIIVSYNTKELTLACINSIFVNTYGVEFEVILVDNNSIDGSKELLQNDNRIKYIQSNENLGFGKANNLGYNHSRGRYIFLLNSDTLLLNNAIKMFYDEMESRAKTVACMGCLLVNKQGERIHSYGRFPTIRNEIVRRGLPFRRKMSWISAGFDYADVKYIDKNCFAVEYITGADMFIRREVIEKYGLFDPAFFMYYEETEMQHRYSQYGYVSCIIKGPRIIHLVGGGKHSRWNPKDLGGLMIYFRKIYGNTQCKVLKILLFPLVTFRIIVDFRSSICVRWNYLERLMTA